MRPARGRGGSGAAQHQPRLAGGGMPLSCAAPSASSAPERCASARWPRSARCRCPAPARRRRWPCAPRRGQPAPVLEVGLSSASSTPAVRARPARRTVRSRCAEGGNRRPTPAGPGGARTAVEPRVVRGAPRGPGPRRDDAQMACSGAGAQAQVQVQVLHQRTLAVHGVPGFAFVTTRPARAGAPGCRSITSIGARPRHAAGGAAQPDCSSRPALRPSDAAPMQPQAFAAPAHGAPRRTVPRFVTGRGQAP